MDRDVRAAADLARAFEMAVDPMCVATFDGWFLQVNPAFTRVLGHSAADLTGRPFMDFMHPDDHARTEAALESLRTGENPLSSFENRCRHSDGTYRWLNWSARTERTLGHIYATARDVTADKETASEMVRAHDQLEEVVAARTRGLIASNELLKREIAERRRAAAELRTSEQRYRALVEDQSDLICRFEPDTTLTFVNRAYARFYGAGPESLVGTRMADTLDDDGRRILLAHLAEFTPERSFRTLEREARGADGEARWHLWSEHAFFDDAGAVTSFQAIGTDITERRRTEARLRQLSQAVEQSPVSVVITDTDGSIVYVNPQFEQSSGYAAAEVLGRNPRFMKSGHTPRAVYEELWRTISAGGQWQGELHNKCKDGSMIWEQAAMSPIYDDQGRIANYLCLKEDITLRKEYESKLVQRATFDHTTGLPNRFLAVDRLGQAIGGARRNKRKIAVLFVDLDNFKMVNDTMGHACGDELLRLAGKRFADQVRRGDTVARLGGDEFMIILGDLADPLDADVVAEKLVGRFNEPFVLDGLDHYVSASVGIAVYPDDGEDPDALMRNADSAMYRVKQSGRNGYRFFTPEMDRQARTRIEVENRLRHALENGELTLNYQPIVQVADGRIHHAESLLRWNNPDLGQVAPDTFIPVAEETGLIASIGAWVLQEACRQMAAWRSAGLSLSWISVNVSSRQFHRKNFVDLVLDTLDACGLEPGCLNLEITESVLMEEFRDIEDQLHRLAAKGVRMTIDDFGTGYSSLSYLRRFPVRTLKVDKSFIRDVIDDTGEAKLVEAIIAMGRSLDLEVIAEGVEEEAQYDFLRDLRCDMAQGFLFGRPVPADAFAELAGTLLAS
ncbi:MAG: EAL domain-containing protein [Hyphomicrobiales bacterium]|nr:EAL domain-containing protein [Hyphomicrobiales bacterium]